MTRFTTVKLNAWLPIATVGLLVVVVLLIWWPNSIPEYADVHALAGQLSLLPVAGTLVQESHQDHVIYSIDGGVDPVYIEREYRLTSTPTDATVTNYYRTQLVGRGWTVASGTNTIANTAPVAAEIALDFRRIGKHANTLDYLVTYNPGKAVRDPVTTLDVRIESTSPHP